MDERKSVLDWVIAHALARVCGAAFGFAALWLFMRLWGDADSPGLALLELGLMFTAGLLQGALLGLLPGRVLMELLPEADFMVFVRNTVVLFGLEHLLAMVPVTLSRLDGSISVPLATWSHTLASITFALAIGPAQWFALRRYVGAGRYVAASTLAQLGGLLLDWLVQTLLPSFELDLPAVAIRLTGMFVTAGLVALPTGWVLVRLARRAGQKAPAT